jgi:hypothetical protein
MAMSYPSVEKATRAMKIANARARGHDAGCVILDMDRDWMDTRAECDCGWQSRKFSNTYDANRAAVEHMMENGARAKCIGL